MNHSQQSTVYMSPSKVGPILEDPGVASLAVDMDYRLLWCNEEYARNMGSTPAEMVGTTLSDFMTEGQAREREMLYVEVLSDMRMHAHQQVWKGQNWLTRVWPLDPAAFDQEGFFVLITRMVGALPDVDDGITLIRHSDLGPFSVLTPRELEVLYYLGMGMSNADVASLLFRAEKTISNHADSIYKKMRYDNRAALVRDVVANGIIHFSDDEWKRMIERRPS